MAQSDPDALLRKRLEEQRLEFREAEENSMITEK